MKKVKLTCKRAKYLLKDELEAKKDYSRYKDKEIAALSKQEGNHAKILKKKVKQLCKK